MQPIHTNQAPLKREEDTKARESEHPTFAMVVTGLLHVAGWPVVLAVLAFPLLALVCVF